MALTLSEFMGIFIIKWHYYLFIMLSDVAVHDKYTNMLIVSFIALSYAGWVS